MRIAKLCIMLIGLMTAGLLIYIGLPHQPLTTDKLIPQPAVLSAEASPFASMIPGLEQVQITRVVDGDTIEVNLNSKVEKVRFLGINTPETVDPRKPVECFGPEASQETKKLLAGQVVVLEKDTEDKDKY